MKEKKTKTLAMDIGIAEADRKKIAEGLSALLADMPGCGPEAVETLPVDVMGKLQLNVDWMQGRFPSPDTFLDISTS